MGQHRHRRALGREPVLLTAVLVAALVGSFVAVRLVGAAQPAAQACSSSTSLSVAADAAAVPWLTEFASSYTAGHHLVDSSCVAVSVRPMSFLQAQQALQPAPFPGGGKPPDVWLPDSTTAVNLVRARAGADKVLPPAAPSVASSPIVVAAPTDAVRALIAKLPAGQTPQLGDFLLLARDPAGWGQQRIGHDEWGPLRFSMLDPGSTTLGVSLLVAAAGAVTGTQPRDVSAKTFQTPQAKAGLLQFVRSLAKVAPSGQSLLDGLTRTPSTQDVLTQYGLIVTYERDIWRYNGDSPAVQLQASYPLGGTLAADYPFVVPNATWVDGMHRRAAADFRAWLLSPQVQDRLGSYGLRRANGTAGPGFDPDGRGLGPGSVPPQPARPSDAPATARAVWRLFAQRVSILALIDVSGSMAETVPQTHQSKLAIALAAARASLQLFDPSDHIGLWEFSTRIDGDRDYRQLVPLGPAGGKVGGKTRREASIDAYARMRPLSGTGLYDSILAAYESAVAAYQDGYVNTVVVLTDGQNDDDASISLDRLLGELQKRYSLARPVHVVAIAYGKGADAGVLGRIASATDGLTFDSPDPRDIGQIFLTAINALTT